MKMLKTVEDIVEALGGTGATAAIADVRPSTVSNWKLRGNIPPLNYMKLAPALEARRLCVDPAVFKFR